MKQETAFITGINGQDGSYLAEKLINDGIKVVGMVRRNSVAASQTARINHLLNDVELVYGDITDMSCLISALQKFEPEYFYNTAAQSHVQISFQEPIYTCQVDAMGVLNILESIKLVSPKTKLLQCSSSEMFGNSIDPDGFQRESTPMAPVSPYGCAKLFAYNIIRNYRNSYGVYACNAITFNHESPRRGENFVTQKVVQGAVRIYEGKADKLHLGNLHAYRDWSHAKDCVSAFTLMMKQDNPKDYVIASGKSYSVQNLCEYVFGKLNLDWKQHVVSDSKFLRPEELNCLKGDSTLIKQELGWEPQYTFYDLIDEMLEHAL